MSGKVDAPESAETFADGRTKVAIHLPENGSVFVLFKNAAVSTAVKNYQFSVSGGLNDRSARRTKSRGYGSTAPIWEPSGP